MKFTIACFTFAVLMVAGCASKPATSSGNAPSGTWSGDYGPDSDRRDPVTLDLRWEDSTLRGTVHSGPRSLDVHNASFKPETGAIALEFDAQNNGRTVHYMIEGKVDGNKMSGSWRTEGGPSGDFKLTRQ
jgi:hypothetical protein